ncbi:hypothetical protein IT407_01250 [Candidatus Uhrbacteria bacterium]|nr:hypothetical protein [Candidatus Uhrbacteria bacterium]
MCQASSPPADISSAAEAGGSMFLRYTVFTVLSLFLLGLSQTARAQTTEACYTGPPGTAGVGVCRSGSRSLVDGPCDGEVLPWIDVPDNGIDEDCSGADLTLLACGAPFEEEASFSLANHRPVITGVIILSLATLTALIVLILRRRKTIRQRDIVTERIPRYTRNKDEV